MSTVLCSLLVFNNSVFYDSKQSNTLWYVLIKTLGKSNKVAI